jgi:hypothetical protein
MRLVEMSTSQTRTTRLKFLISEQEEPLPCCGNSILSNFSNTTVNPSTEYTLTSSPLTVNAATGYDITVGIAAKATGVGGDLYLQVLRTNYDGQLYTNTVPLQFTNGGEYRTVSTSVTLAAGASTIQLKILTTSTLTGSILGGYLSVART